MNRRGFLSILGVVAATAVLDPERLLWVPGAKTISIARPQSIQDYIERCHEDAMRTFGCYMDAFATGIPIEVIALQRGVSLPPQFSHSVLN